MTFYVKRAGQPDGEPVQSGAHEDTGSLYASYFDWALYLPHQCDAWVIADGERDWVIGAARRFREELDEAIRVLAGECDVTPHSDCDGQLTPAECRQVAPCLREVIDAVWPDDCHDRRAGLALTDGMDAAANARCAAALPLTPHPALTSTKENIVGIEYVPVYDENGDDVGGYTESVPDLPDNDEPPEDEPTLAELLAATAAGTWGAEAAIWLLDQHGHWLPELDRLGLIRIDSTGFSFIRWDEFAGVRPIATGSEIQVLNVARALALADGASTFRNLASLDEQNRRLVLHAIAWGMGGRAWADTLRPKAAAAGGWGGPPQGDPWFAESPF